MAKQPENKADVIREMLAAHPGKGPTEISELLKAKGLKIEPGYVSVVKSQLKPKRRKAKKGKKAKAAAAPGGGFGAIQSAVDFIRSAGGLGAAKEALNTVEEISKAMN